MAKLYFYYSAMNAGKSTILLQSNYNYRERGMNTIIFAPLVDNRGGAKTIKSRIGIEAEAQALSERDNVLKITEDFLQETPLHCVLVDEAQFLSRDQVYQLTEITDQHDIPVLAFGLRTDFRGELFEGSRYLLAWADNLKEIKTVCQCGRKATMVVRLDTEGNPTQAGSQIEIGGNDRYLSLCRKHFKEALVR
ncbi:MAG: thymidine kinase [Gammaproteobacteria bacterium]|nr:thymidine kinase [Gammaproteobacteria bacterium]